MSDLEKNMTSNLVTFQVDGQSISAEKGSMLIKATDAAGIPIPRFCYHKHLSIAANCRMCLVDIEKMPKPMPACATPVAEGMIVRTRSEKARAAQNAMMEFLLINHPLDCPICDQGGECELQDLALSYGTAESKFIEEKRSLTDPDLGALVATHMTRCIKCTRCVRFGEEIADIREMGATGRGESTEIGTFIDHELASEISANIIDICPVGALLAKPSEYQARPWEYMQHESIAIHDVLGANTYIHTLRGKIARVAPRENTEINDTWIADRDRFSYEALHGDDRALRPMVKMGQDGLVTETWERALAATKMAIEGAINQYGVDQVGFLVSPLASVEEQYLAQKFARSLGINNIDHRFAQTDFSDDAHDPIYPALGVEVAEINAQKTIFMIGADLRLEVPVLAIKVRSAVKTGAKVARLSSYDADQLHKVDALSVEAPQEWVATLANIAHLVAQETKQKLPAALQTFVSAKHITDTQKAIAKLLLTNQVEENTQKSSWLVLGQEAITHPAYSVIRALAQFIAEALQANFGFIAKGGNAIGAHLTGVLPHRLVAGEVASKVGKNALAMITQPLKAYVLVGAIDYTKDLPAGAYAALQQAELVVHLTPFASDEVKNLATIVLPIAAWGETSGSLVNGEGRCQTVNAAALPKGEARPAWKVLRVMGNAFDLEGFDYLSSDEILEEWLIKADALPEDLTNFSGYKEQYSVPAMAKDDVYSVFEGIYQTDAYVRRSSALQKTPLAKIKKIALHSETAKRLDMKKFMMNDETIEVRVSDKVAKNTVRISKCLASASDITSGSLFSKKGAAK